MPQYFEYGEAEKQYLSEKDPLLGAAIRQIGDVRREVMPDLYAALVLQIVAQQISTKGAQTVYARLCAKLGAVTPKNVCALPVEEVQNCGMSMRKAGYIREVAERIQAGQLNLQALHSLPDEELCVQLSGIRGIGRWTAEMLMTFSMQRPDILSYGDIAIHRGLRMLYRHRAITPQLFQKYKRRYSPCATVASLYLWEIAGGACPALRDPAPKAAKGKRG